MGPIWVRQDPGGPHVGPMNLAIWDIWCLRICLNQYKPKLFVMNRTHSYSFSDTLNGRFNALSGIWITLWHNNTFGQRRDCNHIVDGVKHWRLMKHINVNGMDWHMFKYWHAEPATRHFPEPKLTYCQLHGKNISENLIQINISTSEKMPLKILFATWRSCWFRHRGAWWRHQMKPFSALPAICARNSPVTAEFPAQSPVTRSFDVFFDLCLNERLSKQSRGW